MSEKQNYTQVEEKIQSKAAQMFETNESVQLARHQPIQEEYEPLSGVNNATLEAMRQDRQAQDAKEINDLLEKLAASETRKKAGKAVIGGVLGAATVLGGTYVATEGAKEIISAVNEKAKTREAKERKNVLDSNNLEFDTPPKFVVNDKGALEVQINMSVKDVMGNTIDYDFDIPTMGLSIEQASKSNIEVTDLQTSSPDMTGKVILFNSGVDGSRQMEVTITTIRDKQGGFKVFKHIKLLDSEGKLLRDSEGKPLMPPQQTEVKGKQDFSVG